MNQDVPRRNVIDEINYMINGLSEYKDTDLSMEDNLGTDINFKNVAPIAMKIMKLFSALRECDLELVPTSLLIGVRDAGKEFFINLEKMRRFSISEHANPRAIRDQISGLISDSYDEIYNKLSPVISFARKQVDYKTHEAEIKKDKDEIDELLISMKSSLNEISSIKEKAKQAAQEGAVATHAIHFKKAAEEHENAANRWLLVTGGFTLCAIVFAYYNYVHFADITGQITAYQNLQLVVAKVIVFSLLLTGIVWSGRIYRANRHNYIINKHRHNALNTFETFAKSTADEQIKAAVLLQTTQCIFSQQHSGYITQESETGGAPQILEIVRGIYGQPPK